MITERYEPHQFPKDVSPRCHLGTSRRGCTSQSSENDDLDRFIEHTHAALEEATKEEDAKDVLQELLERLLAKTGAPLMADVICEQLRSQEIIEQLAEQSFDRQQRAHKLQKQLQQQRDATISVPMVRNRRLNNVLLIKDKYPHKCSSSLQPQIGSAPPSQLQTSLSSNSSSTTTTKPSVLLSSPYGITSELKVPHDPETMDEAVTRDQFIIQQSPSLHTGPDCLLMVSEYIWRLFRLLILASLVALVYHYVCTHPYQLFLVV